MKKKEIGTQFREVTEEKTTQTEVSFTEYKLRTFLATQKELEEVYKLLLLNKRLDDVVSNQGSSVAMQKAKLSEVLTTFMECDLNDFGSTKRIDYQQLREDFNVLLMSYSIEIGKSRELNKQVAKCLAENNVLKQQGKNLYEGLLLLDGKCLDLKEELKNMNVMHEKCGVMKKTNSITKSKVYNRFNEELDSFQEFVVILGEVNGKIDPMQLVNPIKIKYYYRMIYNFLMSRIDFIKKKIKVDENHVEPHFLQTFFFEAVNVIGAGGNFSIKKLQEFLILLVKCQLNPKVMFMCRALGLVEERPVTPDFQRLYLKYMQMMNDFKEGVDVPVNFESCKQYYPIDRYLKLLKDEISTGIAGSEMQYMLTEIETLAVDDLSKSNKTKVVDYDEFMMMFLNVHEKIFSNSYGT